MPLEELRRYMKANKIVLGKRAERPYAFKLTAKTQLALDHIEDKTELNELLNIVVAHWVEDQLSRGRIKDLLTNGD